MDDNHAESSKKNDSRDAAIERMTAADIPRDIAAEYYDFSGPYPKKPLQPHVIPLETLLHTQPKNISKEQICEASGANLKLARELAEINGDENKAIGYVREIARSRILNIAAAYNVKPEDTPTSFKTTNALDIMNILAGGAEDPVSIAKADISYRERIASGGNIPDIDEKKEATFKMRLAGEYLSGKRPVSTKNHDHFRKALSEQRLREKAYDRDPFLR